MIVYNYKLKLKVFSTVKPFTGTFEFYKKNKKIFTIVIPASKSHLLENKFINKCNAYK